MFRETDIFKLKTETINSLPVKNHPDFKIPILHDEKGDQWTEKGSRMDYINGPYFLESFELDQVVKNKNKKLSEIIGSIQPIKEENKRFSNLEALENVQNTELDINPKNVNADLGLQKRIKDMVKQKIIDENSFVILSHGHFMAGDAELSRATTEDGKYIFDTSVYFPKGNWSDQNNNLESTARQQFQLWSEKIEEAKSENSEKGKEYAGGIAISLFGHRGRWDLKKFIPEKKEYATAHINPEELFGSIEEFEKYLKSRNLDKVVIITEEPTLDPEKINRLPLDRLKNGVFGDENKDLFDYFDKLSLSGVKVEVVNGDTRPPTGYLAKKLSLEDNKKEDNF